MKFICSLIFITFTCFAVAQKSKKPVIGRVVYHFSHVRDTAMPTQAYTEDMVLFFSTDATIYKSYKLMYNDSINDLIFAEQLKTGVSKNSRTNVWKGTHEQIVHFYSSGEMV